MKDKDSPYLSTSYTISTYLNIHHARIKTINYNPHKRCTMFKIFIYALSFSVVFLLQGCTGADAGDNITVTSGKTVKLSGEGSKTSNGGKITKYTWEQDVNDDFQVKLSENPSKDTTFVAPQVHSSTVLHFTLRTVESYACKYSKSQAKKICKKDVSLDTINVIVTKKKPTDSNGTDYNLTGKIIDIVSNQPVVDANVSVEEHVAKTDKTGAFSIQYSTSERNIVVTVKHKDYFSNTRTLQSTDENKSLEIKIAKPLYEEKLLRSSI